MTLPKAVCGTTSLLGAGGRGWQLCAGRGQQRCHQEEGREKSCWQHLNRLYHYPAGDIISCTCAHPLYNFFTACHLHIALLAGRREGEKGVGRPSRRQDVEEAILAAIGSVVMRQNGAQYGRVAACGRVAERGAKAQQKEKRSRRMWRRGGRKSEGGGGRQTIGGG